MNKAFLNHLKDCGGANTGQLDGTVGVDGMNLTFAHKYIGVLGDNNELECQKRASLSDAVTAKLRDYVIDGKCMIEQYMYHRG